MQLKEQFSPTKFLGPRFDAEDGIDWERVTILTDVSIDVHNPTLYCKAKAHGARVLADIGCDMAAHGIPNAGGHNCVRTNGTSSDNYFSLNFSSPAEVAAFVETTVRQVNSPNFRRSVVGGTQRARRSTQVPRLNVSLRVL